MAGAVLLSGMLPAAAQAAPAPSFGKGTDRSETRTDYDSRTSITSSPGLSLKAAVGAAPTPSAVRKLRNALGVQGIVDSDKATGTPRRVARLDGYLTAASRKKPPGLRPCGQGGSCCTARTIGGARLPMRLRSRSRRRLPSAPGITAPRGAASSRSCAS